MKISRSLMRRLGTCLLCLAAVVVLATSALTVGATQAESGDQSRYTVGTEIQIPDKSFDGVEAVAMVTAPSGVTYRVEKTFTPTENGIHTLTYAAYDAQGVRHEERTTFEVIAPVYAVGNARSSVKLGKYSYGSYTVDRTAILAAISSTDKFSYAQIIDLEALNGESFLEFFVTPETLGVNDVYKINVVLTDLYDPENFITIAIKRGTGAETAAWLQRTSYLILNLQ